MTLSDEMPTRAMGGAPAPERPAGVLVPERGSLLAGRYRVETVIGFGGMGLVLSALDESGGDRVAIKLLLPPHREQPEARERFEREAQAGRLLTSEHACRVLDAGALDDGTPFFAMELLEGKNLATMLREVKRLPAAEAVDLALQACDAMAEAHSHDIVHRDVKPSNLVLTARRDGSPCWKLIDFGVSKHKNVRSGDPSPTRTYAYLGSPVYSAPEQLDAARAATTQSDQWSLAVVLYECLAGELPFTFTDDALWSVRETVQRKTPTPLRQHLPSVAPDLAAAVHRALSKRAEDRFPSIHDFARAIAPFGGEEREAILALALRHAVRPFAPSRAPRPPIEIARRDITRSVTATAPGAPPPSRDPLSAISVPTAAPETPAASVLPAVVPPATGSARFPARLFVAALAVFVAILGGAVAMVVAARPASPRAVPASSASESAVVAAPPSSSAPSEAMVAAEASSSPSPVASAAVPASSARLRPRGHGHAGPLGRTESSAAPRFMKSRTGE